MSRLLIAALLAAAPAHAKVSLRRVGDWLSNVTHPCHFPPKKKRFDASRWALTWSDEFNGSDGNACFTRPAMCQYIASWGVRPCPEETQAKLRGLDKCKWSVWHFKNYMAEAQHNFDANDVSVEDGMLVLTSRARTPAPAAKDCKTSPEWTAACPLSAGGVESRPYGADVTGFAQQHGRFEVRAKLPRTPGSWPAHWLMPHGQGLKWPDDGEIDIMESFGGQTRRVAFTLHWADGGHQQDGVRCALNLRRDFADDFHVFAVEWEPGEIRWFVDEYQVGKLRAKDRNKHRKRVRIPAHPFYWLLNTSISPMGMPPGEKLEPARFPTGKHYIDYVRVYRRK